VRHKSTRYALLLLGIIPVISLLSCAGKPEPVLQWSRTFGRGSPDAFGGGLPDGGYSVQQTTDGGYVVCGYTQPDGPGSEDIWLIKTDADGNKLWDKTFSGGLPKGGNSAQQTTDGGYIVCGTTASYGTDGEGIWLIKTDADGNKLWDKMFGPGKTEWGNLVRQTTDSGYIVCGTTATYRAGNENIWLIKTDADGNKLWDKTFGGEDTYQGRSVQQTTDGGYIVCGGIISCYPVPCTSKILLIKTDGDGNKLWDKTFGGGKDDYGFSVQQTGDDGYIVCGSTRSRRAGDEAVWLIKTDGDGNKLWDKTFGGKANQIGDSVQQTKDGGYIICGTTIYCWSGTEFCWRKLLLIKTDAAGSKLWDKIFEGKDGGTGYSVQQTTDGGYVVCGETYYRGYSDVLLLKIAPLQ
jgi:hypothetical protein